jgi:hypothetical protein
MAGERETRWLTIGGAPIRQVQEWMGHATITMTMRSAHLAPGGGRRYLAALDVAMPSKKAAGVCTIEIGRHRKPGLSAHTHMREFLRRIQTVQTRSPVVPVVTLTPTPKSARQFRRKGRRPTRSPKSPEPGAFRRLTRAWRRLMKARQRAKRTRKTPSPALSGPTRPRTPRWRQRVTSNPSRTRGPHGGGTCDRVKPLARPMR